MMEIRHNGDGLTVTWERTDKATHGAILDLLKAIPGAEFDRLALCWHVPAKQADRLYASFPKASYDYDAIGAVVEAQERRIDIFARNLEAMGVRLTVRNGRIIADGGNVSPLVQKLVDERSAFLAAWLRAQNAHNRAWRGAQGASMAKQVQSSILQSESDSRGVGDDLHNAELMRKSLHNAAVNQERQEALRRSRRGKDGVK